MYTRLVVNIPHDADSLLTEKKCSCKIPAGLEDLPLRVTHAEDAICDLIKRVKKLEGDASVDGAKIEGVSTEELLDAALDALITMTDVCCCADNCKHCFVYDEEQDECTLTRNTKWGWIDHLKRLSAQC